MQPVQLEHIKKELPYILFDASHVASVCQERVAIHDVWCWLCSLDTPRKGCHTMCLVLPMKLGHVKKGSPCMTSDGRVKKVLLLIMFGAGCVGRECQERAAIHHVWRRLLGQLQAHQ